MGHENCFIVPKNIPKEEYLDRKALVSLPATANLAFNLTITHQTPSVFRTDQRGNRRFLIQTLGPEFWGHPHPHGEPQHLGGQGLILEHIT